MKKAHLITYYENSRQLYSSDLNKFITLSELSELVVHKGHYVEIKTYASGKDVTDELLFICNKYRQDSHICVTGYWDTASYIERCFSLDTETGQNDYKTFKRMLEGQGCTISVKPIPVHGFTFKNVATGPANDFFKGFLEGVMS